METRVTQRYEWITTYSRGIEDGPYKELLDGEVIVSGQYRDGQRDGLWKHVGPNEPIRTANYRNGRLHGWYEITDPQRGVGRATRLRFVGGKLIERDGQPIASRLFDLYQSGKIDDSRLAKELMRAHGCAFDASLRDAVALLIRCHHVPIEIDETTGVDSTLQSSEAFWDMDLCTALTLLTEPRGLACDYRYGCLWITTANDVLDWYDPTGVSEIEPGEGSVLAGVWDEPVNVRAAHTPLRAALTQLAEPLALNVDFSRMTAGDAPVNPLVSHTVNGLPFRHVLGALLYKAGCRCELAGDTLVIMPPDAAVAIKE
jgi:hypothetical protein